MYSRAHDGGHVVMQVAWLGLPAPRSLRAMLAHTFLSSLTLLSVTDGGTTSQGATATNVDPDETYRVDIRVSEDDCYDWDTDLAAISSDEEPEPDGLTYDGAYFIMGAAPATTLHATGFHPNMRYDMELGLVWQHEKNALTFGLDGHVMHYFGRKTPGGGADVVITGSHNHFYARGGVGVATGIPRSADIEDFRPAVGGVVGIGMQGGEEDFIGRIGVDYDVRFDDGFGMTHTVLVVARLAWGI